jgi:uroporphyrinogen decarboxylase
MASDVGHNQNGRIAALLARGAVDRVPCIHKGYSFCAANVGFPKADIFEFPEKSYQAQKWTMEQYGAEVEPFYTFVAYGSWEFGGEIAWPEDRWSAGPSVSKRPVQELEDVYRLELPDVKTAGCLPRMMQFAKLQEKNNSQIAFIYGSPFTFCANLCGVDKLLEWAATESKAVHHTMRLMTDHLKQVADLFIGTFGAERVLPRIASPTDGLVSPRMYERLILPYRMELHQYVLDQGVKHIYDHICGDQNHNLPKLAQLPWGDPGMLSLGHEVDLLKAAELFPNEILCGNVEPAIIVRGTAEEVYEACRKTIEIGKQIEAGYIFMGGCDIPATVPPHHIYLMGKAAKEFGAYT